MSCGGGFRDIALSVIKDYKTGKISFQEMRDVEEKFSGFKEYDTNLKNLIQQKYDLSEFNMRQEELRTKFIKKKMIADYFTIINEVHSSMLCDKYSEDELLYLNYYPESSFGLMSQPKKEATAVLIEDASIPIATTVSPEEHQDIPIATAVSHIPVGRRLGGKNTKRRRNRKTTRRRQTRK